MFRLWGALPLGLFVGVAQFGGQCLSAPDLRMIGAASLARLVLLHDLCAALMLASSSRPPLASGITWSMTNDLGSSLLASQSMGSPQMWQLGLVRRMMARNLAALALCRGVLMLTSPAACTCLLPVVLRPAPCGLRR